MVRIFGAKFNYLSIAGLMVLAAFLLVGIWKVVDHFNSEKPVSSITSKELIDHMRPRWHYEDSMALIRDTRYQDSLRFYSLRSFRSDSLMSLFYNNQNKRNENYNSVHRADLTELYIEWANRYGE